MSPTEFAALEAMVDDLPRLLAEIDACGLPDTLVHGDLHPGNWRRDGLNLTLLDGGDCLVGNPAFDGTCEPFSSRSSIQPSRGAPFHDGSRPGAVKCPDATPSGPSRSSGRSRTCAPRRHNQRFLDHVDLTEQTYDLLDSDDRLRRALTARC